MEGLLGFFGGAVGPASSWAVPAAFLWGVLSVYLSPCHLTGVLLVVAYMNGGEALPGPRRAIQLSTSFAAGTVVSIAAVGLVTVALGRIAGDVGRLGSYGLAAVFLLVGLHLMGVVPFPTWTRPSPGWARGASGALLLGVLFGAALGPCTFAFMAPVLAVAFAAGSHATGAGLLLVVAYAVGHAAAIAIAGITGESLQRRFTGRAGERVTGALRGAAGLVALLGGLYFLYTAP